jgi:tetratricopeptide (TPR) repeat protein
MGHVETLWKGTLGGFAALRNRATLLRLPGVPNLMSSFARSSLVAALLLISLQLMFSDDTKAPAINPELAAADQLYRAGKFAEAEASYQTLLKADAKLVPAHVGLVRAMLRQQKIDEALDAVNTALAAQPSTAALLAAKGDVQFRHGEMPDAEGSYLAAKKLDPKEVRAYLGLARLYRSYSLYRRAYDQLQSAHEIAPDDIEVQRAWLSMLPRKERLAAMEAYLGEFVVTRQEGYKGYIIVARSYELMDGGLSAELSIQETRCGWVHGN